MLANLHTRSNLTSILEPRCPPNPQLGAKMAPSWKQNGAKTLQVRANMAPRPPTWSEHGPKTSQLGAKIVPSPPNLEPRWSQVLQLGAKMTPRPSNLEPRWSQDLQFGTKMARRPPTWSLPKPPKTLKKPMMFIDSKNKTSEQPRSSNTVLWFTLLLL